MDTLSRLVDSKLAVERETTRLKIRLSHLKLQNRTCEDTENVLAKLLGVEDYIDERVGALVKQHPAYPWFSKVKGIGPENIGKCLGPIRIKPEQGYRKNIKTKKLELVDLPYATTISDVWAFSGYGLNGEGKAMKPKEGEVLHYNKELRSMWWRLGSSILKASLRQECSKCGKLIGQVTTERHECEGAEFTTMATSRFGQYYLNQKAKEIQRFLNKGGKIIPASELPKDKNDKKYEPDGVMSEGHIHNRALRKMIKLFQACLFLIWREAEGLPPTKPYAIDVLGHDSLIKPWEMVDR